MLFDEWTDTSNEKPNHFLRQDVGSLIERRSAVTGMSHKHCEIYAIESALWLI